MNISFFGSSLVSAYWNGAATYYRGIIRQLHARGHRVTFYEPDAFARQEHRDIANPFWCEIVVYSGTDESDVWRVLDRARHADVLVKASGVGVWDELLEEAVPGAKRPGALTVFWDVDAPATLARMRANDDDALRRVVGRYDGVFTYGGGAPVVRGYEELGARACTPIYNALDPGEHYPVSPVERYRCDLALLANRLPDREERIEEFFFRPARALPEKKFVLGGNGWGDKHVPDNVSRLGHVYTAEHNALNASAGVVLNVARDSMAEVGWSPATRIFEAAGAAACVVTDAWRGIEDFLAPDREVLVAHDGDEVARHLSTLTPERARAIGEAARARVLADHTYAMRACEVERALEGIAPVSSRLDFVFLGLSLSSSWGNGHATTYRALLRALAARGHRVLFLERNLPWYAENRDLPSPSFAELQYYDSFAELTDLWESRVRTADVVVVGSYVPEGVLVGEWVTATARGATAFYDIDTPITVRALTEGSCAYLNRELVPRYSLYLSFTGGPLLSRLERRFGANRARPLYCCVDPDGYFPEAHEMRWDLGYLGTYSANRQPALDELLVGPARSWPEGRFVVAGAQFPPDISWPPNVERAEHVPPPRHRRFYCEQRFTLNVTRADMVRAGWSPSVRIFEAAACGTPIISDAWPGLARFLVPGREVLVARSTRESLAMVRRTPERERVAIGRRARARVLAEHTASCRAEQLERDLMEALERSALERRRVSPRVALEGT